MNESGDSGPGEGRPVARTLSFTAIGRPLDPAYATNKAVLILLPVVALATGLLDALETGATGPAVVAGLTGMLVAFGSWALARELAPDDNPAAFVAMALALAAFLLAAPVSAISLFVALFLVRVVNRSVGRPATAVDTAIVVAMTGWATLYLGQPLLGIVGALAFAFDARLPDGRPTQWLAAVACAAASGFALSQSGLGTAVPAVPVAAAAIAVFATLSYAAAIALSAPVRSVGDATGFPLDTRRVQAGMFIGLLVVAQSAAGTPGDDSAGFDKLGLACLLAVGLGAVFRRAIGSRSASD